MGMTNGEAAAFLQEALADYEKSARLDLEWREASSQDERDDIAIAARKTANRIDRRSVQVEHLLRAAGLSRPPALDLEGIEPRRHAQIRSGLLRAIGVFERGLASAVVEVKEAPPAAPAAPRRFSLQEAIQSHWMRWAVIWIGAGFSAGYFLRDAVDRAVALRTPPADSRPAQASRPSTPERR